MRLHVSLLVLLAALGLEAAPRFSFHVTSDEAGAWPAILSSLGLTRGVGEGASVVVVPRGAEAPQADWAARVEQGTILVLEGESKLATAFGFKVSEKPKIAARSVKDFRAPDLRIVWEKPLELPIFEISPEAKVFAQERWLKAPLMAGFRRGAGAVLWVAASPGAQGYERFPYIPQALADLGLDPPFRSGRLWAFFDSSYRLRVDLDYFAQRWRASGIGALHVAAWHYWERDPERDAYLQRLMEACHRNSIQVYAWLELPHVSEKLWDDHPGWREKTASLQDAKLDWRKLVNLQQPEASAAVTAGVKDLLTRFDWDGANLAELYFESLEGVENPARFTPMNQQVRADFQKAGGFDPLALFDAKSPLHWSKNADGMKRFLDFRASLAARLQVQWISEIENIRKSKPHLDLVLTHIDDRFDTGMKAKLGADVERVLPLLASHDFTFLIEDPATIWNLGPQRYPQIAARYAPLTPAQEKLAIDVNIVERYQDVYPTKQQTGVELFQLIQASARSFPRLALYFESSLSRHDYPWLASAAATVDRAEQINGKLVVESRRGAGVPWTGAALVDGKLWPMANETTVWLPRGAHAVEKSTQAPVLRILDFNGEVRSASSTGRGVDLAYQSNARAYARLERIPKRLEIDGVAQTPELMGNVLVLPRGQHLVTIE